MKKLAPKKHVVSADPVKEKAAKPKLAIKKDKPAKAEKPKPEPVAEIKLFDIAVMPKFADREVQAGMINVSTIDLDADVQTRQAVKQEVVEEYAEAMRSGAKFPPVDLVALPNGHTVIVDGEHRILAAMQAFPNKKGAPTRIEANVRKGTLREAQYAAVAANARHGLKRSSKDKRNAVARLLTDKEWSKMSDRAIAEYAFVSHPTVSQLRAELVSESEAKAARTGKDGVVRKGAKAKKEKIAPSDESRSEESTAITAPIRADLVDATVRGPGRKFADDRIVFGEKYAINPQEIPKDDQKARFGMTLQKLAETVLGETDRALCFNAMGYTFLVIPE